MPIVQQLRWALRVRGVIPKMRAAVLILRGYDSEICKDCGRGYLLWWCENDDLYIEITEKPWARGTNGCKLAAGLFCPPCFDRRAEAKGYILEWRPRVFRTPDRQFPGATYHGERC